MALQGRVLAARYELGPRLGAGGMAGVYQATDQVLDRTVAVKVLGPPYDQDPDFVDQFRHESRMAPELGLVHRDIKPANVMVDQAGLVKVMDFGIAKAAAATTTTMLNSAGQLLGTAPYLSPEQAQGRPVDGRSDLYALGCVLYELLTGTPPFRGHSPLAVVAQQVSEPPEPPSHRNSEVGAELDAVVLTAL